MRNIVLSVVVIAALVASVVGGTLADFSDIEVSEDNYFNIGAMDLVVSDQAGTKYNGDNVPAFVQYEGAWPCSDKSYFIDLHNYGQGIQYIPYAYLHFKNVECYWIYPKILYKWVNEIGEEVDAPAKPGGGDWAHGDTGTGYPKPVTEPEYVAEYGGLAGELADGTLVTVPGIGPIGEDCRLADYVDVQIEVSIREWDHDLMPPGGLSIPGGYLPVYTGTLADLECTPQILRQITNCKGIWVHIIFHLQEPAEEDFYWDDDDNPATPEVPMNFFPGGSLDNPWNDWVTNAFQKDGVSFDMAFELFQSALP